LNIKIGDTSSITKSFDEKELKLFSKISMDTNPLHLDLKYASKTRFGNIIVHGLLVSGLISAVLGTKLPGPGVIYLSQQLKFLQPVYINEAITANVEVIDIKQRPENSIIVLKTLCINQEGKYVIEGEAVMLLPK
jgi:3-hydroxybutyryl-CoA dehydratase